MLKLDFWDNFTFWDKEWLAIRSAPHILFGALVIVILVILLIFVIVRWGYRREIAGLKAEKAALKERVSLAYDAHALVTQQVKILTEQVAQLSQQISQKDTVLHLAYTSDTVTGTVQALSFTNDALGRIVRYSEPD